MTPNVAVEPRKTGAGAGSITVGLDVEEGDAEGSALGDAAVPELK
jgi:hypothetical protein